MPVVQDSRRAPVVALLAGVLIAACSGCNSGEETAAGVIQAQPPTAVRLVDCGDWREAGPKDRARMVAALRKFAGGLTGSPGGHGATLKTDDAYKLFDSYCANDFADGFKLYKLYTRAAAFSGE
jgi:hypothetical protein